MPVGEIEIERVAIAMIARYGTGAAREAVTRLNQTIDRGDWDGRERWACVVHTIHERQGLAPGFNGGPRGAGLQLPPAA